MWSVVVTEAHRRPRERRATVGGMALAAMLGLALADAPPAGAQSGEPPGTEGIFLVPAETCESLRDLTDGTAGSTVGIEVEGDIIVVCDGGDDTGRRFCEVLSGSTTDGVSAGQGIGFCADSFPNGVELVEDGPLKEGVDVLATSFGAITGTSDVTVEADMICETFAPEVPEVGPGRKICRQVLDDGGESESCDDDFILTPTSDLANENACQIIADQLATSVTEIDPTNLAFALFIDLGTVEDEILVPRLGQEGSEALFVCPGRRLACPAPDVSPLLGDVTVDYQIAKVIVLEDPDCIRIRGRRICGKTAP